MTQETEKKSEKPASNSQHTYIVLGRLMATICAIAAVTFTVFGLLELFKITQLSFVRMGNSFIYALLFGIFGMTTRIYTKLLG